MIKYLLVAILALAIIGGAFKFESNDESWQLIILKKEALNSVSSGTKRIYSMVSGLFTDTKISEAASIVREDN